MTEEQANDPAYAAELAEALKAVEEFGVSELSSALEAEARMPGSLGASSLLEPAAKKQKAASSYSGVPTKGKGVQKGKNGLYMDIVWTPQLAMKQILDKAKDAALARAIFNACEVFGGQSVTLSQLGSDFNVSQLKKDPQFKNHKLIDIIRYHENVFEVVPDPAGTGGFVVRLHPGAEAALPDADTYSASSWDAAASWDAASTWGAASTSSGVRRATAPPSWISRVSTSLRWFPNADCRISAAVHRQHKASDTAA